MDAYVTTALCVENVSVSSINPDPKNARQHSSKQLGVLARAIKELGFNNPILIDKNNLIIAGHGRLEAAKKLGMTEVPIIRLEHLSPEQVRAYRIADNRIAELATWNEEALKIELHELSLLNLNFDLTVTGFETAEIDYRILSDPAEHGTESVLPIQDKGPIISRLGDLWRLGEHRLYCGDSSAASSYTSLLCGAKADLIFTDPPYNVPVNGHILTGAGHMHEEFAMACGEMTDTEYVDFLKTITRLMIAHSRDGSIHFICMDWRHIYHLLDAGKSYNELKNICIWNKANGGMGALYRSKHEMVCVFKHGNAPHTNNIQLGKHGRYRTNVWDYAGQTSPHAGRLEELAMHPTVKPVAMIADAICDCSHRCDIVLDPFGGSGSTLIAAEQTGRVAHLIEISPRYVDVTIRRWQSITGQKATLHTTGQEFDSICQQAEGVDNG